jgi:recombination protein RecR
MLDKIPTLKNLLHQLQQVPFLASKNIYKVASYFLDMETAKVDQFCKVLQNAKQKLVRCQICFVWIEREALCMFCQSADREQDVVCVVESWHDMLSVERAQTYKGVYHILGGVISPLEGIRAEYLTIAQLLQRCGAVKEIIIALGQTPQGDVTSTFIVQQIQKEYPHVLITSLARGVPVGASLEFIDRLTLTKAMHERRPW